MNMIKTPCAHLKEFNKRKKKKSLTPGTGGSGVELSMLRGDLLVTSP